MSILRGSSKGPDNVSYNKTNLIKTDSIKLTPHQNKTVKSSLRKMLTPPAAAKITRTNGRGKDTDQMANSFNQTTT